VQLVSRVLVLFSGLGGGQGEKGAGNLSVERKAKAISPINAILRREISASLDLTDGKQG
jgi:hypothetical protein